MLIASKFGLKLGKSLHGLLTLFFVVEVKLLQQVLLLGCPVLQK